MQMISSLTNNEMAQLPSFLILNKFFFEAKNMVYLIHQVEQHIKRLSHSSCKYKNMHCT